MTIVLSFGASASWIIQGSSGPNWTQIDLLYNLPWMCEARTIRERADCGSFLYSSLHSGYVRSGQEPIKYFSLCLNRIFHTSGHHEGT
jgi:hypothetical protein